MTPGGMDPRGVETLPYLQDLVGQLARRHEVHVFALRPRTGAPFELRGARIHNVGGWKNGRALLKILTAHRQAPFDVLHAFWAVPEGLVAAVAGRLLGLPVLVHVAGGELVSLPEIKYGVRRTRRGRIFTELALRGATRISGASEGILEHLAALGFEGELVPLGVDVERWRPRPPVRRAAGAPLRLIHVGSLNPVKDQGTLLEAAAILSRGDTDFTLDVVGMDTLEGALQRRARELGLEERVRFHGHLGHPELRPLVEDAHLLVMSSRHEAGPVVVLEAAVAGVPTVGTRVGHIREWHPEAAVAVPVGDAPALAAAVEALAADETRRLRLAREAAARALARDVRWTAERFTEIYREIAHGPAS